MKNRGVFAAAILATVLGFSQMVWAYSDGDGSAGDPYQIATKADLLQLAATTADYGKHFILTANIDLAGQTFTAAVIAPNTPGSYFYEGTAFTGTFDGGGHIISNLNIVIPSASGCLGLFGCIASGSEISNVGLVNVNISGFGSDVGALCGYSDSGVIDRCCVSGIISGETNIGGLCGWNYGTISRCYASGAVAGFDRIGGLCGWNSAGSVNQCYSVAVVMGDVEIGGLVGYSGSLGEIQHCEWICNEWGDCWEECYMIPGEVESPWLVVNSFWDEETSCQTASSGGDGKTTIQMQTTTTFTSAGWDFSDTDGDPADWMILRVGEDYPRMTWQPVFTGDIAGLYGINLVDITEIAVHWGQTGCPAGCEDADVNEDGTVDLDDLLSLVDNWLELI